MAKHDVARFVDVLVEQQARFGVAQELSERSLAALDGFAAQMWRLEVEICRLPDSLDVPLAHLSERVDALPRDGMLVILCHHGMRSQHAARWLRAQGFANAVNLAGGIDAWARLVDPSMRTY